MKRSKKHNANFEVAQKGPAQPLQPITNCPLTSKSQKSKKTKEPSAETYRRELQAALCRQLMPLSPEVLRGLERWQLLLLASFFKAYHPEVNSWTKDQLIPFVQGYQDDIKNYHPIKIPKRVWVPELETQKYKELFGPRLLKDPSRIYAKAWP